MIARVLPFVCVAIALSACSPQNTLSARDKALLEHQAQREMTCKEGADCTEKWSKAVQWVTANSAKSIKTLTDNMIQTESVYPGGREAGGYPAFSIIKYPIGHGNYRIQYDSACEKIPYYTCTPSALVLRATFTYSVMGSEHPKAPSDSSQ